MNKLAMPLLGACLLLGACNNGGKPAATAAAPAPAAEAPSGAAATGPVSAEAPAHGRLTAARIAEIKASGKSGIWSDPAEVCAADHARGMITWNVTEPDVDRVTISLVGKDEKVFAQGGPAGEKATGPWLRPGMVFKLRTSEGARELGTLTVGERQDCAPAKQ
jgi:hypothetical protein